MSRRRPFSSPSSRIAAPRMSTSMVLRALALGLFVVFAAGWAVVRHFTQEPPPMLVPVGHAGVPPEPTYDIEAGELPVPETLEPDAS